MDHQFINALKFTKETVHYNKQFILILVSLLTMDHNLLNVNFLYYFCQEQQSIGKVFQTISHISHLTSLSPKLILCCLICRQNTHVCYQSLVFNIVDEGGHIWSLCNL